MIDIFMPGQAAAVDHYLTAAASSLPPPDLWDASGRAFPDIAAVGVGYEVVIDRCDWHRAGCPSLTLSRL